jgi:hypothetical protein
MGWLRGVVEAIVNVVVEEGCDVDIEIVIRTSSLVIDDK